ncbi:MAG: tetratricopeptide repeat protein [Cyanobacteria bacterium SZAS LIN-3]|nr:tetratricopeptide repeat protein [Cyanobacteria bacterium SZAS LIN-3]MBS2008054.1 tetratricopeptide repeat protein [Cyanobacteria bacterium SZAS TMP-1]
MVNRNSFKTVTLALSATVSLSANAAWTPAGAHGTGARTPVEGVQIAAKKNTYQIRITREVVRADSLMLGGKYDEAAELYKGEMTRNPNSVPATVGYGMALAKQFKLDGADEKFNKVLALDPQNAMAHAGKAMVMLNRLTSSSGTVIKNRDATLRNAEAEVKQALTIDPGMPEGHLTLGNIYKEQGKIDDAIAEYKQATSLDPKFSEAFGQLGIAELTKDQYANAVTAFKQAIALNSGNSTAHYGLGRAYYKQGLLDQALTELNTSLYQNRNSYPVHLTQGDVYAAQGNTVAAVQQYQESIRLKPENPDAYLHIADIRESRGDLELSNAELRSGLEMMPNNADLHLRVADNSLKLEKLDDAIKEYNTVLNNTPGNSAAAKGLTRAYYLKANKEAGGAFFVSNEYENAQSMIDKAVAMNPNDMELRLAQAKLRSMAGTPVDLSKIGTPTNDGERVAYAEALLAQNRFSEADQQMQQVIANASDPKQAFAVADLALMIKDLPDAEAAYRKASMMPGGQERGARGLALVAKAKDASRQDLTLADDLARRSQLSSAIDKYHAAIFGNPKVADTRMGLAKTLERLKPEASKDLREAIVQYKAYEALTPNMPPKELEKLNKKIDHLNEKAYKLEQKEKERGRS